LALPLPPLLPLHPPSLLLPALVALALEVSKSSGDFAV
jgi:hypothetical protein